MKKIYVLTLVCLTYALVGSAQNTYYWIGASGGNWDNNTNWSLTSHGSAATAFPNGISDNVVFDTSINVNLDLIIDLNSLSVINGKSAKITSVNPSLTVTLHSTSAAAPGLRIDAGSKLESDAAPNSDNVTTFVSNGQAVINGEWLLSGNIDLNGNAYFDLGSEGSSTQINVNNGGKITIGQNGFMAPNDPAGDTYLVFKAGSTIEFKGNNVLIAPANYDPASTILLDGLTTGAVAFGETGSVGNLIFNCPALSNTSELNLYDLTIDGDLLIQNTNGQSLGLVGTRDIPGATSVDVVINGNLVISGTSAVVESRVFDNKTTNLIIQGNFTAGGQSFSLQDDAATLPTNLIVKKNFIHSAGSFGAGSGSTNESTDLFNIELSGSSAQTLSSTGSLDNLNHQVTLRINNANGITLASDVAIGRLDFNTVNKGIVHAGAHVLTINNTSESPNVVSGSGNNAYVEGSVGRKMISTNRIMFPTGVGNVLRPFGITPLTSAPNTFVVNLVSGSNGTSPNPPIAGLANYYWNVSHPAGPSSAVVQMNLVDAVTGASATDTLVPVAFVSNNWKDVRSTPTTGFVFPGNSTSGSLISNSQSTFNAFSIGYIINSTLAIKLVSFTGKKIQNTAELSWEITDNSTPAKFEVLKSDNGKNFVSVGSLPGMKMKLTYSLTDNSIVAGNNYYRLKMYDDDGSVTYSNIIVIMNGSKGIVISAMMPTVVTDRARLSVSSSMKGSLQLVVTDISGRIVQSQLATIDSGNQDVWLNASALSTGMFQVTGYINGEKTATFRFIKQ